MVQFTNVGYADMHFKYSFCDGNGRAALMEYQCQYPDRTQPNQTQPNYSEETDAVMPPAHTGYGRHNVQNEEEALDAVHVSPLTDTYQVIQNRLLSECSLAYTAWGTLVPFLCTMYKSYSQRTIIFTSSSVIAFYRNYSRLPMRQRSQGLDRQSPHPAGLGTGEFSCYLELFISTKI
jgi:hypothetical protein